MPRKAGDKPVIREEVIESIRHWLENPYNYQHVEMSYTAADLKLFLDVWWIIQESCQPNVNFIKTIGLTWEFGNIPREVRVILATFFHRVWDNFSAELREKSAYSWCRNSLFIYLFISKQIILDDTWHRRALGWSCIVEIDILDHDPRAMEEIELANRARLAEISS